MIPSEAYIPVLPPRWYRTNYGIATGAPYGEPDQRERRRCEICPMLSGWTIELPNDSVGRCRELGADGIYRGAPGYKLQRHHFFHDFAEVLRVANAYADGELHPEVVHQDVVRYVVVRDETTGRYYDTTVWNDEPVPDGAEFHDTWDAASKRAARRNRALFTAAKRRNLKENP